MTTTTIAINEKDGDGLICFYESLDYDVYERLREAELEHCLIAKNYEEYLNGNEKGCQQRMLTKNRLLELDKEIVLLLSMQSYLRLTHRTVINPIVESL